MPDPIVDAAAASSPAADLPSVDPSDTIAAMSETERHDWRMTGKLPDAKDPTPPADSSPAEPVEQVASTDAAVEATTEVAAADPIKAKTKARIDEVLAGQARERARAERAEAHIRDLEARSHQPPPDARPAASSAAPAGLVKPDPAAFDYGTSDPAYLEALTDYKVAVSVAQQREAWDQHAQHVRAFEESTRVITAFEQKAAQARQAHPDFDVVAMLAPTEIQPGTAADLWVLEDEAGAEILYHLQQPAHAAERRRILAMDPRSQLKELVRLGDRLTAQPPTARSTQAPPPPPTLSTRATPGDPVERAIRDGDTAAYNKHMNERELARIRGR